MIFFKKANRNFRMSSLKHASITFNPSFKVELGCISDEGQIFHIHIEFNDDVIKVPIISVLDFKRSYLDCYDNKHIKMNYRYNVPYLNIDELDEDDDDIDRYSAETYGMGCEKKADVFFTRDAFMIRCELDNPTFKTRNEKVEEGETVWGPEIHGICANRNADTFYKSTPTIDICIKKSYVYAALIQHGYDDCIPKLLELARL